MTNFSTSATFNLQGKDTLTKLLETAGKAMSGLSKEIKKSNENLTPFNKTTKTAGESVKTMTDNMLAGARTLKVWNRSTKGAYSDTVGFGQSVIKANESLSAMESGISGLALKLVGVQKHVSLTNALISPMGGFFMEIADASSNTERAFVILDAVAKPVNRTLKFMGDQLQNMGRLFQNFGTVVATVSQNSLKVAGSSLGALSAGLARVTENLSKQGIAGRLIANQLSGVGAVLGSAGAEIAKSSEKIDPTKFQKLTESTKGVGESIEGAGKKFKKAALGVQMADFAGDAYRAGLASKELAVVVGGGLAASYGLASGKAQEFMGQIQNQSPWQNTQKAARETDKRLQDGFLKTLAQIALKAGDLILLAQTFKTIGAAVTDVALRSAGLNDAFTTMQSIGVNTQAAEIAFQFGLVGEKLLYSADAAKQFGQAVLGAYAQLQDQAAFVTTLSAGAELGIDGITEAMQKLVNGPLKNTVTSVAATEAFYNTISAGVGVVTREVDGLNKSTLDTAQSANFMEAALKLASGSGANSAQTLDTLAKVTNVYKLSNLEAGVTAAKMYAIVEDGQVTFNQLAGGLGRVSSVARSTGVSIDETFGSISALTKVMTADDAMTGFASLMNAIAGQGAEAEKAVKELGIQFDVNTIKAKGLLPALNDLYVATNGNASILKTIIPDSMAFNTALNLMTVSASAAAQTTERVANAGEESLDKVFGDRQQSLVMKMTALMNGFNEAMAGMANQQIIDSLLSPGVAFLERMLDVLQNLPDPVKAMIGSIVALQVGMSKVTDIGGIFAGMAKNLIVTAITARLMHLLFTGQLIKEGKVMQQLIFQQRDFGEALKRVVGIQTNYSDGALALSEAQTRAASAQERLQKALGQDFDLKNIKGYEGALESLGKARKDLEASGLSVIDPLAYQKQKKLLGSLEKDVRKVFTGFDLVKVDVLKDARANITKNLADMELTLSQKKAALVQTVTATLSPMDAEVARIATQTFSQIPAIMDDATLDMQGKIAKARVLFGENFEQFSPKVKRELREVQKLMEQGMIEISQVPLEYQTKLQSAFDVALRNLPESARKAGGQTLNELYKVAADLDQPFIKRREAIGQALTLSLQSLPESVQKVSPQLEQAINAMLADTSIPFQRRQAFFSQYFAQAFKEADASAKPELQKLRATVLSLVSSIEAPLRTSSGLELFAKGIEDNLIRTRNYFKANGNEMSAIFKQSLDILGATAKDPSSYQAMAAGLEKGLGNLQNLTQEKFLALKSEVAKGFDNLDFDGTAAANEARKHMEKVLDGLDSAYIQAQLMKTNLIIEKQVDLMAGAFVDAGAPEEAARLKVRLEQELQSFDSSNMSESFDRLGQALQQSFEEIAADLSGPEANKLKEALTKPTSVIVDAIKRNVEEINNVSERINLRKMASDIRSQVQEVVNVTDKPFLLPALETLETDIAESLEDTNTTFRQKAEKLYGSAQEFVSSFSQKMGEMGQDMDGLGVTQALESKIDGILSAISEGASIRGAFDSLKGEIKQGFDEAFDIPVDSDGYRTIEIQLEETLTDTTQTVEQKGATLKARLKELITDLQTKSGIENFDQAALEEKIGSFVDGATQRLDRLTNYTFNENLEERLKAKVAMVNTRIESIGDESLQQRLRENLTSVEEKITTTLQRVEQSIETNTDIDVTQSTAVQYLRQVEAELNSLNSAAFSKNVDENMLAVKETFEQRLAQVKDSVADGVEGVKSTIDNTVADTKAKGVDKGVSDIKQGAKGLVYSGLASAGVDTGVLDDTAQIAQGIFTTFKTNADTLAKSEEALSGVNLKSRDSFKAVLQQMQMNVAEKGVLARTNKALMGAFGDLTRIQAHNGKVFGIQVATTKASTAATGANSVAIKTNTGQTVIATVAKSIYAKVTKIAAASTGVLSTALGVLSAGLGFLWTMFGPITVAVLAAVAAFLVLKSLIETLIPGIKQWTSAYGRAGKRITENSEALREQISLLKQYKEAQTDANASNLDDARMTEGDREAEALKKKKEAMEAAAKPDKAFIRSFWGPVISIVEFSLNQLVNVAVAPLDLLFGSVKSVLTRIGNLFPQTFERVKDFIKGIPLIGGALSRASESAGEWGEQSKKTIREVGNFWRRAVQDNIEAPYREAMSAMQDANQELVDETNQSSQTWSAGGFASPEAKALLQKAISERRSMRADELRDAIDADKKLYDQQYATLQDAINKQREEMEGNSKIMENPVLKAQAEQEIASLEQQQILLEANRNKAVRYRESINTIGSALEINAAAKNTETVKARFEQMSEGLTEEAAATYKDLLGFQVKELKNSFGDIESTEFDLGDTLNLTNAAQRQAGAALGSSLQNVFTVAARTADPTNPATVDEVQNSVRKFEEQIEAALEAGTIDSKTADNLKDRIIDNLKITAGGVEGTLKDIYNPAEWQGYMQRRIDDIEKYGVKEVAVNQRKLQEIDVLEQSRGITGLEATKQRAVEQEAIDNNMVSIRERQLAKTARLYGEDTAQYKAAQAALLEAQNQASLNSFKNKQTQLQQELDLYKTYLEQTDFYTKASFDKRLNELTIYQKQVAQLQKAESAKQDLSKSITELETATLSNKLKVTGDITDKAAIQTEIAEKRLVALQAEQAFEMANMEIQLNLNKIALEQEGIQLAITKLEGERNLAILERQLLNADANKLTDQERLGLRQQIAAIKEQNGLIDSQITLNGEAKVQNEDIAEDQMAALRNRQRAALDTAGVDLEITKQAEIIAGYDEQIAKIRLAQQATELSAQQRIQALEKESQLMNHQVTILEKQKELISSRASGVEAMYNLAIQGERNERRKQRIERERERAKLDNLAKQQEMERKVFDIQQLQKELSAERAVIESEIAIVKAQSEAATARAEAAKTNARKDATEEEKAAANLAVAAADMSVAAAQQTVGLNRQNLQMTQDMQGAEREMFDQRQGQEMDGQRLAVAQTTRRRGDDRRLSREFLADARNQQSQFFQPTVNNYALGQGVAQNTLYAGGSPTVSPNTGGLPQARGFIAPDTMSRATTTNPVLTGDIKVTLEVSGDAAKLDKGELQRVAQESLYKGLDELLTHATRKRGV